MTTDLPATGGERLPHDIRAHAPRHFSILLIQINPLLVDVVPRTI